MKGKGIILLGPDKTIESKANQYKLPVVVDPEMNLIFGKQLVVEPATEVPWDLVPAAWHFLERWDAAVPLWRYGTNACDVGTKEERQRTEKIVLDMRVLLYSHELLFLRKNAAGEKLREAFLEECQDAQDKRLAFLRAYYRVKPKLCVLPRSWLAEVDQRSKQDARSAKAMSRVRGDLIQVEIKPGVFVRCREGDEERVREKFEKRKGRRKR